MTEVNPRKATELLAESERAANLRDRHRDYYVALAEQAEVELRGPDQGAWWELLESEYDNLRLALEWSLSQGVSEAALRLAIAINGVWYMRGDLIPSREWLEKALALDQKNATRLRASALEKLSFVAWPVGDMDRSFSLANEALRVAKQSADSKAIHEALVLLGQWRYVKEVGGLKASRAYLEESLAIARELGDEHAIASSLGQLAWRTSQDEGREAARALSAEATSLLRKLGDKESIAWSIYGRAWDEDPSTGAPLAEEALAIGRELKNDTLILCVIELIGWQRWWQGDYIGALKVFEGGVEEYRRPGRKWPIPWGVSWMLAEMADLEFEMGDFESAQRHADEALEINQRHSYKADTSWPLLLQGKLAAVEGDHARARSKCEQAVEVARETGRYHQLAGALRALADVARWAGDHATARAAAEEALSADQGTNRRDALASVGQVCFDEGALQQARSYFEKYLEHIHTYPWWPLEEPGAQLRLGRIALAAGELETASALHGAALTKLQEIGHKPFVAWALEEFGALAAQRKEFERAARLFGAAEAIREEAHAKVPMDQRRTYEQGLATIKEGLSEDAMKESWAAGRGITLEAAVQYALEASSSAS